MGQMFDAKTKEKKFDDKSDVSGFMKNSDLAKR